MIRSLLVTMGVEDISFSFGYPTDEHKSNMSIIYKVPGKTPLEDAQRNADELVSAFAFYQDGWVHSYLVHRFTHWMRPGPHIFDFGQT